MAALRRTSATKPSAAFLVCLLMAALERTACAFIIPTTKASRHNRRHQRGGQSGGAATTSTTTTTTAWSTATAIAEIDEITDFACRNGIDLKFTTRGPGYRCVAASKSDPENVLGYVEGFIRPTGRILHADKMEIFKSAINSARRSEEGEFDGGGSFLGPGLLIAYVCLLHGRECGCETAEFLAIDDAEYQHKRLIRYYRMAGFREVRYVGEELKDIPDRLVWGGCGTLMTEDIDLILTKWTRIIRRSKAKMEGSIIQE